MHLCLGFTMGQMIVSITYAKINNIALYSFYALLDLKEYPHLEAHEKYNYPLFVEKSSLIFSIEAHQPSNSAKTFSLPKRVVAPF